MGPVLIMIHVRKKGAGDVTRLFARCQRRRHPKALATLLQGHTKAVLQKIRQAGQLQGVGALRRHGFIWGMFTFLLKTSLSALGLRPFAILRFRLWLPTRLGRS